MKIEHKGLEQFRRGTLGNGGDNLFVDANGVIRRIMDNDLDGDGFKELIFSGGNQLMIYWNDQGVFHAARRLVLDLPGMNTQFSVGLLPVDVADVDGDSTPELVVATQEGIQIRQAGDLQRVSQTLPCDRCSWVKAAPVFLYYGTADHRYPAAARREYPVRFGSSSYVAADVDNDGYVELITTSADSVRIFQGTPHGPDPSDYVDLVHTPGTVVGVGGVLVGDYNRDGWLDLIMTPWMYGNSARELENSVFVYLGGPHGFSNDRRMVLPSYIQCAQSVLLADIDNDGYVDFLYGDKGGFLGVYSGGPEGFSRERFGKIPLRDHNGATILGLAAADVDGDGWLELFVTTAGHYTRRAGHVYVLRDGRNGYPQGRQTLFETGGTTGFPALADMYGSGHLDLLLPFYSTAETRELPARIFRGDGTGSFDWNNPLTIDCPASIAFCPVDLSGNGFPDLFICCHRNNLGHMVNSKLIMNGPDGLDLEHAQDILGYGPHCFTSTGDQRASLQQSPYDIPVRAFLSAGHRAASLDLPCHGQRRAPGRPEGIGGFCAELAQGRDLLDGFVQEGRALIDALIGERLAEPGRILTAGTSRGGYCALRLAAADPRVAAWPPSHRSRTGASCRSSVAWWTIRGSLPWT
ncbi:MAG: FG-GAP-like repeat-containing protein [Candidatus Latescibacterota bacterium]